MRTRGVGVYSCTCEKFFVHKRLTSFYEHFGGQSWPHLSAMWIRVDYPHGSNLDCFLFERIEA